MALSEGYKFIFLFIGKKKSTAYLTKSYVNCLDSGMRRKHGSVKDYVGGQTANKYFDLERGGEVLSKGRLQALGRE